MSTIVKNNNPKNEIISIVTPCFNEESNVTDICIGISKIMKNQPYKYEHIFIDNCSTDSTVKKIKKLAKKDKRIKLIVNTRNFGAIRSPFYGVTQSSGNACILIPCDFQVPLELIDDFLANWKKGFKVVLAQKKTSDENFFMFNLKKIYYRFMTKISEVDILENCTGYGLYDKVVIKILRDLDDPYPYLRGLLMEIGYPVSLVSFHQPNRKLGVSSYSFYHLYDYFMLGITQHSRLPLSLITMFGFLVSIISFLVACYFLIAKILFWDTFSMGFAPILIGIFFFGSIQAFFIGIIGEYIGAINSKVRKLPLVIESERINFK